MFYNSTIKVDNQEFYIKNLLFKFHSIELYTITSYKSFRRLYSKGFTLLFIFDSESDGVVSILGKRYPIKENCIFLCPKGKGIYLNLDEPEAKIKCYLLHFDIIAGPFLHNPIEYRVVHTIDLSNNIIMQTNMRIAKLCHIIYQLQMSFDEQAFFHIQAHFYELISRLQEEYNKSYYDFWFVIRQSKKYIDSYYFRDIKLEDLAEIANLSKSYFLEKFRELYNITPIKYLNHVRIQKAKFLLGRPYDKIRNIALKVGYSDEFYFSRKFKQTAGITPIQFAAKRSQKIAVHQVMLIGYLVPLNIVPYATSLDQEYWPYYYHMLAKDIMAPLPFSNKGWFADIDKLCESNPDKILSIDTISDEEKQLLKKTDKSTLFVSSKYNWREQLKQVAQWLDVSQEAVCWLDNYDNYIMEVKNNLQPWIKKARCLIMSLYKQTGYVMNDRSIVEVFGQDLQLNMKITNGKRKITLDDVISLNPDCILMLVFHNDETLETWKLWSANKKWKQLDAVKNQRVYMIDPRPWREYSAYGHYQIVKDVHHLFSK